MLKFQTHYNNLKVSKNASDVAIRAAYKALMQQYHPDKFDGNSEKALRIVKIIQTSYAVLSNPHKRARHDAWITAREEKQKSKKTGYTTAKSSFKQSYYQRDKQNPSASESAQYEQKKSAKTSYSRLKIVIPGFILAALILAFVSERKVSSPDKPNTLPPSLISKESKIEFVFVKSGCFQMGNNGFYKNEKPLHRVCLTQGYHLGKYEVTQAQWQNVMSNNPSHFKGNNLPVEKVSWNDVQTFISRLNQNTGKQYRLPTEAEWEFACRSGSGQNSQKYCGGNRIKNVAWYVENSASKTHPVGKKKPNGLGFYDMSGNVMEWTQDRYHSDYYRSSPANDPKGPLSGSEYVVRGGSWMDIQWLGRSAQRQSKTSDFNSQKLGFRLARSP